MKVFPVIVLGSLAIVAVMWANLDALKERFGGKAEVCKGPYEVVWIPWAKGLAEQRRKDGKIVWLTFSADWGLLSKHNEAKLLASDELEGKLAEYRVVLIRADMTQRAPDVETELRRYGLTHLPANLIFSADAEGEVMILPEVLTPEIVIKALEKAASQ